MHYYRFMATHFTTASCPTCETSFDRIPVEYDGDQGYAALELKPCCECGTLLCPCCEQFQCDGCAANFCPEHLASIPDGTLTPLRCCATCAAEVEVIELPLAPLVRVCEEIALLQCRLPGSVCGVKRILQPEFCRSDAEFTAYVLDSQF